MLLSSPLASQKSWLLSWGSPACRILFGVLVLMLLSLFPSPYISPFFCLSLLSSSFPFICYLAYGILSPSSLALFPPCRTRWWKAASAQSSRSGVEGGSVFVGMKIKTSTGELRERCSVCPPTFPPVWGRSKHWSYNPEILLGTPIHFRLVVSSWCCYTDISCLQVKS